MKLTTAEVILIAGFLIMAVGIGLIHIPAALIASGILLMYAGWPKGGAVDGDDKQTIRNKNEVKHK